MVVAIPNNWDTVTFDVAFTRITNKVNSVPTSDYQEFGSIPIVDQGKELFAGYVDDESLQFSCSPEGLIVFGDHTRIVKFIDQNFVLGADGTQLLEAKEGFYPKYLYHLLKSKDVPNTGYNRHFKFLKEMIFVKPPFLEQQAIAKALSDIDQLINETVKLLNKKERIFEGFLHSEFSELSGTVLASISDICDVNKGSAAEYDKDFIQGAFGFLNGGINFSGLTEKANDSGDTVVVSEGGNSCGFVNYMPIPFWCGGHAYRLTGFNGNQKYLFYALKKSEKEIMNLRVGSGLPNIQKKNLSEFKTLIHEDQRKQEKVSIFLDSLMSEIDNLKLGLNKYKYIKQGMTHDLLTGKVRLV